MRRMKKSGITALTAAIALGIGAIPVAFTAPALLARDGALGALVTGSAPAGTLTLATTSASGTVTWSGSPQTTQEFTGGQFCEINDTSSVSLLDITGDVGDRDGVAGFRGGSIGVFEFDNASQCFRVDAGSFTTSETLRLKLGDDLEDRFGALLATSGSLKLLKQQSGTLKVTWQTLLADGETVVESGGFTSGKNVKSGTLLTQSITSGPFAEVRLTAVTGSFSLVGPTSFTLTSSADATFCDPDYDNPPEGSTSQLTDDNGTRVSYIGDASVEVGDCFSVSLDSTDREVTFLKPLDVSPDAQFIFDITWTLPRPETPGFDLPEATIDFEFPDDTREETPDNPHPTRSDMPFCPEFLYSGTGADRELTGLSGPPTQALLDRDMVSEEDAPSAVGTQFACIDDSRRTELTSDGLTVIDKVYLIGDAKMRL